MLLKKLKNCPLIPPILLFIVMSITPANSSGGVSADKNLREYILSGVATLKYQNEDPLLYRTVLSKKGFATFVTETGRIFQAGSFSLISLKNLRSFLDPSKKKPVGNGTFNIILSGDESWKYVDIMALQAAPENKNALFQVASNFNALEGINGKWKSVEEYCNDPTQGPFAALSAAPGAFLREEFLIQKTGQEEQATWESLQTTKKKQVVLLPDDNIEYKNGYLKFKTGKQDAILKNLTDLTKDFFIGYQKNVQVTFDHLNWETKQLSPVNDPSQLISQAFTAALFIGWDETPENDKNLEIAKLILKYAYETTIRLAAAEGHKKVYLTLLGGGAFDNPTEWVIEAIKELIPFIKENDLTVILNGAKTFLLFDKKIKQHYYNLVAQTGGTVTTFFEDKEALVEYPKLAKIEEVKPEKLPGVEEVKPDKGPELPKPEETKIGQPLPESQEDALKNLVSLTEALASLKK